MKKWMLLLVFVVTWGSFAMAQNHPTYKMGYVHNQHTIAHLDGIWHDVKVEFDDSGNIVYRGVHELHGRPATDDNWCVWKYTYDTHNRPTRIEGPKCGKFGWEDKTSAVYWYDDQTLQPGDPWLSIGPPAPYILSLVHNSDWIIGYRPNFIRVTFTGATTLLVQITDYDQILGQYILDETISSGETVTINFANADILKIYFEHATDAFTITKIEFGFNPFK